MGRSWIPIGPTVRSHGTFLGESETSPRSSFGWNFFGKVDQLVFCIHLASPGGLDLGVKFSQPKIKKNPRSTGDAVNCTQLVVHCSIHKEINRKWPVRNDGLWPCKEKSVLLLLQKRPIFQIARCARFVFWYFERPCKIDMEPFLRLFLSKLAFKSNCLDPGTTYRDWQSNFAGWCIAWLACHFTSAKKRSKNLLSIGTSPAPASRETFFVSAAESLWRFGESKMTTSLLGKLRNPQKHGPDSYRCLKGAYISMYTSRRTKYIYIYVYHFTNIYIYRSYLNLKSFLIRFFSPQKLYPKYILRRSLDPFVRILCKTGSMSGIFTLHLP